VPINTSTMLRYDAKTCTVWFTDSPRAPQPAPGSLRRMLAGFALAGLTARAIELALARRH
jgi:hypothetical protein